MTPHLPDDFGEDSCPLRAYEPLNDSLATGYPRKGWEAVARWFSIHNPGQWMASQRGVTWGNGRHWWWLVNPDQLDPIREARICALDLGVECGWSVGSVARRLLKWVGPSPRHLDCLRLLQEGVEYNYIDVTPGRYDSLVMYDVSSYYYDLWCRLPSLHVTPLPTGRLLWHPLPRDSADRLRAVNDRVATHKTLRNALVGVAYGRSRASYFWHRGRKSPIPFTRGLYRGAALAVVRAGWEITRQASIDTDSVFTHTDCVTCRDGVYPGLWDRLGFVVREKLRGPGEVCHSVCYQIGGTCTHYYEMGSRWQEPRPRPPEPPILWHRQWVA